ncbi:nitrate- and nitrite sensing domain-containing protein [Thermoactinospora rubra]|uniref:sensor histidine kinase n=1 Tax=Thermoactinospora rubra TaxID=1088767 RepID=UPI001301E435|nr:nitrate- and nitrite sensing domain-containing protein [Thermoactinospora rubra]
MRWRLTALILVPTIAGVGLAGARVVESVDRVGDYTRVADAAEQAAHIRDLLQAIGLERDTVGWYNATRSNKQLRAPAQERVKEVDDLAKTVLNDLAVIDDTYGQRAAKQARDASSAIKNLPQVRAEKNTARYGGVIDNLLRLHDELSLLSQDSQILGYMRGLSALSRFKESLSEQRIALLQAVYKKTPLSPQEVQDIVAMGARQREAMRNFATEVGPQAAADLNKALAEGEQYYRAELTKGRAITLAGRGLTFQPNLISDNPDGIVQWFNDNSWSIDQIRKTVETDLAEKALLRARDLRNAELRTAIVVGAAILLLLLLVLLFTIAVARSMVTPLRRLRSEALEIAGIRLPDVVRNLRVSGESTPPEVQPIPVEGNDEIGEVAQAFDEVHRQAVRLAAEEAELRSNISAMFVNLSRRTQTLVERQISLIDGLEKGEQDGARLADLFKLDHLATRMRRNSENLLVLAGHEPPRRRSQPARLVDVVRAALSEVEDYERVQVRVHRSTMVVGSAANDLVHLVAELVENAVQFSPKNSQVTVSSSVIEGGGALLSVSDNGISMTEEELAEANRRLAEPPVVDVSVSRRMGLFVVGRLALRHGIRVQLRKGEGSGLIAMVLLPPALIPDASQVPLPGRPAFGGAAAAVPSQNGSFPSAGSLDGYDTAGGGPLRQGLGAFSGDAGSFQPQGGFSPGSHPSFPSQESPFPSLDSGSFAGGDYPSADRLPRREPRSDAGAFSTGAFPTADRLPRREPRGDTGEFRRDDAGGFRSADSGEFHSGEFRRGDSGDFPDPMAPRPPAPPAAPSYPSADFRRPDPPSVEVSPLEPDADEYLPIFAAVESAWFRRPDATRDPDRADRADRAPASGENGDGEAVPSGEDVWRTPADAGWRAAAAASDPSLGGVTSAGLPRRTPKANLVPGSAGRLVPQGQQQPAPAPRLSADRVRSRMASFQQGVRRGRAELTGQENES